MTCIVYISICMCIARALTLTTMTSGVFRGGAQGAKAPPSDTKMNIIKMKLTQIVSTLVISLRSELGILRNSIHFYY